MMDKANGEWQDISVAPRDGSLVYVRRKQKHGPLLKHPVVRARWRRDHWSLAITPHNIKWAQDDELSGWRRHA